jgi:hypothetical protein
MTGDGNFFVAALSYGPPENPPPATIVLTTINNCIVTGSGNGNFGLYARTGGEIDVNDSTVMVYGSSDAGLVDGGSVLKVSDSTIHGDRNGICD